MLFESHNSILYWKFYRIDGSQEKKTSLCIFEQKPLCLIVKVAWNFQNILHLTSGIILLSTWVLFCFDLRKSTGLGKYLSDIHPFFCRAFLTFYPTYSLLKKSQLKVYYSNKVVLVHFQIPPGLCQKWMVSLQLHKLVTLNNFHSFNLCCEECGDR